MREELHTNPECEQMLFDTLQKLYTEQLLRFEGDQTSIDFQPAALLEWTISGGVKCIEQLTGYRFEKELVEAMIEDCRF